MTARIFERHGLRHKGNKNCENMAIQKWIKARYQKDHFKLKPAPYLEGFKEYVLSQGVDFWKGDVMYYTLFEPLGPKLIYIKRDIESVVRSISAKNKGAEKAGPKTVRNLIQFRYNYMDALKAIHGGIEVFTDELIQGNYSSLERAFEYCGLDFDPKHADQEIDPTKWHYPTPSQNT